MYKYLSSLISSLLMFSMSFAVAAQAPSYPLNEQENGIQGSIELTIATRSQAAKVWILDANKTEIDSKIIPGRTPKLEVIQGRGHWKNGSIFLITTDQHADFGSYSGLITRPFQVKNGRIEWAIPSKGIDAGQQITLMQSPKNEWKMPVPLTRSTLDIYEVSCFPDFDHSTDDEAKFELTYRHFHFDGNQWEARAKSHEGCWETGAEKFPDRNAFP